MATQAEYLARTVGERGDWAQRRGALLAEVAEKLAALAVEDYRHQTEVRGVSPDRSTEEVSANLAGWTEALLDRARSLAWDKVADLMYP